MLIKVLLLKDTLIKDALKGLDSLICKGCFEAGKWITLSIFFNFGKEKSKFISSFLCWFHTLPSSNVVQIQAACHQEKLTNRGTDLSWMLAI